MSLPECFAVMEEATEVLSSPEGAAEARRLVAAGAPVSEIVDAFARLADPTQIEQLRAEMLELPETTVSAIVSAWLLADTAGKPLWLTSVPPARPLEAARAQRAEINTSMDEAGVTVALSHIPGRHASWYRPASAVA